jgi:hypothetical protein
MRDELQTARRNFPRAEYELVRDAFPETLHSLSAQRLNARIARCERLIQSYRIRLQDKDSLHHVWRGSGRLNAGRLIRYRMNHLNITLKKFKAELRKSAASAKRALSSSKSGDSQGLTSQRKMRLSRKNGRGGES